MATNPKKQAQPPQEDIVPTETLAETDNYVAWLSKEPDGETIYHLELGSFTLHFFQEEWEEFIALVSVAEQRKS